MKTQEPEEERALCGRKSEGNRRDLQGQRALGTRLPGGRGEGRAGVREDRFGWPQRSLGDCKHGMRLVRFALAKV